MANEIKFPNDLERIEKLDNQDAFLVSRIDGTYGYMRLSEAEEFKGEPGAPFTFEDFTPEQILALQKPATDAADSVEKVKQEANLAAQIATQKAIYAGQKGDYANQQAEAAKEAAATIDDKIAGKLDVASPPLAAGRSIGSVRVVDDTGVSANASPAQIAALAGMDHSLLTEQEVPGKLFIGSDGVPRQVYCRTISAQGIFAPHGNNQAIFAVNTPLINIDSIIGVEGLTAVADGQGVNKSLVITNTDFVLFTYDAGGGYYQANRVKAVCIIDAAYIGQSITLFSNIQYLKL